MVYWDVVRLYSKHRDSPQQRLGLRQCYNADTFRHSVIIEVLDLFHSRFHFTTQYYSENIHIYELREKLSNQDRLLC